MNRHFKFFLHAAALAFAGAAVIYFVGCGSPKPVATSAPPVASGMIAPRDSMKALEFFVDGAMHDLRGEFADAILEYEDAWRLDNAPAIAYACAKDYYELRKAARAVHYAELAIAGDSLNTTYRQLRARIAMNLQMDFPEAQRQFEIILSNDSLDTQTLSDLATIYQFRGQPRRAAALYEKLMDIIGPDGDIGEHLVQLYTELNDFPRAVAVLQECLREDPDDPSLREMLAATYMQMKQTDSAIVNYKEIVERYPDDMDARRVLGDVYSANGDWPAALAQYRILCEDSTIANDTLNFVLDSLYAHLHGDSTIATADTIFSIISDVAEDDTTLWYPCALCAGVCLYLHDDSAAHEWLHEALARTSDSAVTSVVTAQLFIERLQFNDVVDITSIAGRYHDFRLYLLRAFALNRLNRLDEAITALYASLEIFPRNWLALGELGLYTEEQKNYLTADSAFDAALTLRPDYAVVLNNYSYSLAERGKDLDRALEMSGRALAVEPDNGNYLDTYGWILFKMSKLDSAIIFLQRAVNVPDPAAGVIEHLGDAQFKRGNRDLAIQLWTRAYQLDQHNDALREKISDGH